MLSKSGTIWISKLLSLVINYKLLEKIGIHESIKIINKQINIGEWQFLLIVDRQLVNVDRVLELENYHSAIIIVKTKSN